MEKSKKKPLKKQKRQLKKISLKAVVQSTAFIVAVSTVVLTILPLCSFGLFLLAFPVKHFEIEGKTEYGINEIITSAKIKSGNRLYFIDTAGAQKRICEELPHIKTVDIKRKFPDTVCFVIEEKELGWYIEQGSGAGKQVWALDYDMTAMKCYENDREVTKRGMTKLVLPDLFTIAQGQVPVFSKEDQGRREEVLKAIHKFRTSEIKPRLTMLDLENSAYIKLTVDGAFTVEFGDMKDYETKITGLLRVIDENIEKGAQSGSITYTGNSTEFTVHFDFPQTEEENEEKEE